MMGACFHSVQTSRHGDKNSGSKATDLGSSDAEGTCLNIQFSSAGRVACCSRDFSACCDPAVAHPVGSDFAAGPHLFNHQVRFFRINIDRTLVRIMSSLLPWRSSLRQKLPHSVHTRYVQGFHVKTVQFSNPLLRFLHMLYIDFVDRNHEYAVRRPSRSWAAWDM
jgi:hypothetical protein